ncbi:hypothetical protein AB0G05_27135 [Nonomuraea wenchangensis]
MAEDDDSVSAGRIELEVVADLGAGWGGKLQKRVDAELKGVKAEIAAEIDAARVEIQAKAAAEAAERVAKIRMEVELDNAAARTALAGLSGTQSVTVRADVDDSDARTKIEDLGRDTTTTIRPEVDDGDAQARIAELERKLAELAGKGRRDIPVSVNVQGAQALGQVITSLASLPFMVSGLAVLASTAVSAGSGLFALAAGASQAVGALGALPGVAGAAVQGLGTMLLGLSGVREAVNALSSAQASGGQSASAYAAAQEAAAERIVQAQRAIRDANHARMLAAERTADAKEAAQAAAEAIVEAEQRVADAVAAVGEARARVGEVAAQAAERQEDAAYRVELAERRYAEAQRASQRATEALNDARKAAKERLEDLELAVRGGALDEEGAALAVERAKQRLDKVVADPFAKDLDKKEADLAYRQALQRLDEVRERNGDLREEQTEANAKGVEGSDQVTAAKERIAAAAQAEKDAERALKEAREDAAKAAVDGARAIAEAQRGVTEAMKRVRDAEKDVEQAKKAEIRSRRDVREALWNEMLANERLADAKKELIKAQKAAAEAAKQQSAGVSAVAKAMDNLSPAGQRFARFVAGTLQPRMKDLRFAVQEALLPGLQEAIERGMPMLDTLEDGLADTGREIGEVAKEWGRWVGSKEFRTDLATVMASNTRIVGSFGRAGKSAFKGVMDILVVGAPYAERFAKWIERGADKFAEWTREARKDGSMAAFFEKGWQRAKQLWDIIKDVGAGIYELGKIAAPSGGNLLDDLAAAAKDFREWAGDPANQEQIRGFFEDTVTVLRSLGRLLKVVTDLLFTLTDTVGGETLAGFVDTLSAIVGWLDTLAGHPVAGEVIKWTLYLAGVALAIGLIIGKVSGLIKVFSKIPGVTKLVKALAGQVGKLGKALGKMTGLSALLGKLPGLGGGKDGKDGKDSKGSTKVGTMRVTAGTVIVNGKTTGGGGGGKTSPTGGGSGGSGDSKTSARDADKLAKSYDGVGRSADQAGKKTRDLGDSIDDTGRKADTGTKKTGALSKSLDGVKTAAGKTGTALGGLAGALGLDKLKSSLSKVDLTGAFKKINPANLISKPAGQTINTSSWFSKLSPRNLVSSATGEKINTQSWFSKLSPKNLVSSATGEKINTQSWFSKVPPRGLIGDVGGQKINPGGWMSKVPPGSVFDTKKKIDISGWFSKLSPSALFSNSGNGTTTATPTGKTGKTGKVGAAAKVGGGTVAGVGLAVASIFGQDFINEVLAKAEQHLGKVGGGAVKGAIDGGLIGSVVGPIGSLLGAVYGAVQGTVKGAGGNTTAAALGSLVSGPMGLAAGLIPSPEEAVKKLAPTIVSIKKTWSDMWTALTGESSTRATALNSKIGTFTSGAAAKFVTLKRDAPQHVKDAWAAIQRDIDAGKQPSQAKIDEFVRAGGARFLDLKKEAPLAMHGMLAEIQNHAAASLPLTSQKFADFVQKGNLKFAELKAGAPKSLKDAWASIQADAAAGLPPSKAKIDKFISDGGLAFVKLKKDAPTEAKAAWKGVTDATTSGLAPAKKGVSDATSAMEKAFSTAKAGIGKIWGALPDSLKTPIRWVINTGYATIKRMWDGIAGAVGLPKLPDVSASFADGGIQGAIGTATNYGVQPGYSPGRDRLLAWVGEGESWLRPELTRVLGASFIDGGNRAARTGGVTGAARFLASTGLAFAKGGTVGSTASGKAGGKKKEKELSPLEKLLQGVSAAVRNTFSKGLGAGARATLTPLKNAIVGAVGNGTAVQRLIGAVPAKVIDAVIARFDRADGELNRDSGGVLPPGRWSVNNGTGLDEWVLNPQGLAALGGPEAVQALNEQGAAALYRGSRAASRAVPVPHGGGTGATATVIVQPQPGQDEVTIGQAAARRLGALVGAP